MMHPRHLKEEDIGTRAEAKVGGSSGKLRELIHSAAHRFLYRVRVQAPKNCGQRLWHPANGGRRGGLDNEGTGSGSRAAARWLMKPPERLYMWPMYLSLQRKSMAGTTLFRQMDSNQHASPELV